MFTRKLKRIGLLTIILFSTFILFYVLTYVKKEEIVIVSKELADIIENYEIPIYPGGFDITASKNAITGVKSVHYKKETRRLSTTILDFYDNEFQKKNWKPFKQSVIEYTDRTWRDFPDETKPNRPWIDELLAFWLDKDKKIMIFLTLQHVTPQRKDGSWIRETTPGVKKQQIVHCQIMPYIELPTIPENWGSWNWGFPVLSRDHIRNPNIIIKYWPYEVELLLFFLSIIYFSATEN